VVEIDDDSHPGASGSTPETREVEVAGVAILFDRPGQAEDALAAFIVILPLRGAPERRANSDGLSTTSIVEAALLCRGLVPITTLDPGCLREMPKLDRWRVIDGRRRRRLTILEPTGCLFDGLLGRSVPEGWYASLARQRAMVLLIAVGNDSPIDATSLADLCEAGRLMGGLIAVRPTSPRWWARSG
jgi:hypothetical protein